MDGGRIGAASSPAPTRPIPKSSSAAASGEWFETSPPPSAAVSTRRPCACRVAARDDHEEPDDTRERILIDVGADVPHLAGSQALVHGVRLDEEAQAPQAERRPDRRSSNEDRSRVVGNGGVTRREPW